EVRGRDIDQRLRSEITITRKAERRTCYNRSRPAIRNLDNPMTVDRDGSAVSCRLTDRDISRAVRSHSDIARFEQVRSDSRERSPARTVCAMNGAAAVVGSEEASLGIQTKACILCRWKPGDGRNDSRLAIDLANRIMTGVGNDVIAILYNDVRGTNE